MKTVLKYIYFPPQLLAKFNKYICKVCKSELEKISKICSKSTVMSTERSHRRGFSVFIKSATFNLKFQSKKKFLEQNTSMKFSWLTE